jgi:hypothetical protein
LNCNSNSSTGKKKGKEREKERERRKEKKEKRKRKKEIWLLCVLAREESLQGSWREVEIQGVFLYSGCPNYKRIVPRKDFERLI